MNTYPIIEGHPMFSLVQNVGEYEGGKSKSYLLAYMGVHLRQSYNRLKHGAACSIMNYTKHMLPKQLPYLVKIPPSHSNKTIISKKPTFAINVGHIVEWAPTIKKHNMPPYPRVRSIGPAQKYFPDFHP
tara:strand:- start:1050 stop:1436 length:387 start_codon:yes stop_codon:yes gene_type:complete